MADHWIWKVKNAPDARLEGTMRRQHRFLYKGMVMERTFCVSCGVEDGAVPAVNQPHVFILCGPDKNNCCAKYGHLGPLQLPDEIVRESELTWL